MINTKTCLYTQKIEFCMIQKEVEKAKRNPEKVKKSLEDISAFCQEKIEIINRQIEKEELNAKKE